MDYAVLARPQWRPSLQGELAPPADPRIILAPLQELSLLSADSNALKAHISASNPWLVFTSPASVLAFNAYLKACELDLFHCAIRFAAVGAGTRDQLVKVFPQISAQEVVTSREPEKADAISTLAALDDLVKKENLSWPDQKFLILEGQDNRTTLREGLLQRQAKAQSLPLYQRIDVEWPEALWLRLSKTAAGQAGIVVTSTTVIDRLLLVIQSKGLDPKQFVWFTQHTTIAHRLAHAGLGPIGRVRLDAQRISDDLFSHVHNW